MIKDYTVILFYTTSHAFRAEKAIKAAGIECRLVPVPRHLSSDCGVCARIHKEEEERAVDIVRKAKVELAGLHSI